VCVSSRDSPTTMITIRRAEAASPAIGPPRARRPSSTLIAAAVAASTHGDEDPPGSSDSGSAPHTIRQTDGLDSNGPGPVHSRPDWSRGFCPSAGSHHR
jgi:hypothetical protein